MEVRATGVPFMGKEYRSKGRSWVKLWVSEWLDGTTRYEMTGAQRAFWIDLVTMAGRSRVPGFVCAGTDAGKLFGYPLSRYQGVLNDESVDVLQTLKLFEQAGKIVITVTREEEPKLYAVQVLSWERYQSEYMRQRKTRQGAAKVTPKNTSRCAIEGEVEREVEGDREKSATAFEIFWQAYPKKVAKKEAQKAWCKSPVKGKEITDIVAQIEEYKKSRQWRDPQYIPNPATFINRRQWEDEIPMPLPEHNGHGVLVGKGPELTDEQRQQVQSRRAARRA